jgi:hypothetical protein
MGVETLQSKMEVFGDKFFFKSVDWYGVSYDLAKRINKMIERGYDIVDHNGKHVTETFEFKRDGRSVVSSPNLTLNTFINDYDEIVCTEEAYYDFLEKIKLWKRL